MLDEIIKAYISDKEGGAVAVQFEDTFSGSEGFDEQNFNALKYILRHCQDLDRSECLKDEAGELSEYISNLENYIQENPEED